ncbi:MAG: hypothetical protein ACOC6G_00715 [Thermoproteota archaeon]
MGMTYVKMNVRRRSHEEGLNRFFLMALLKRGPLSLKELEETMLAFVYHFHGFGYSLHKGVKEKISGVLSWFGYSPEEDSTDMKKWLEDYEEQIAVESECNSLMEKDYITLNEEMSMSSQRKGRKKLKGV